MKIYVASSWRNEEQPAVVAALRDQGHEVYDFKNPREGDHGFHWQKVSVNWQQWTVPEYIGAITHDPIARAGFASDFDAMEWADVFVLVMPCGRSAHLEAGWAIGVGKPTCIYLPPGEPFDPELMYLLADNISPSMADLFAWLTAVEDAACDPWNYQQCHICGVGHENRCPRCGVISCDRCSYSTKE